VAAIGYQWAAREANQGASYTAKDAEYSRIELWKAGKNMITSKPLLGVGSRRFGEVSEEYGEISGWDKGKNAHNTYIEIAATSGLIGITLFMLMLRSVLRGLKTPATCPGLESLEPIRTATLISLYAIMFRALFDAKAHDWSFYVLCVIGITYVMLLRSAKAAEKDKADATPLQNVVDV
jgi:O-antigen ligase